MVQIKRLFHIFIVIALLLGFSSCGKKESNNFSEVNLNGKTPVQIVYKQKTYSGFILFNGTKLELTICCEPGSDKESNSEFVFCVDSLMCSVTHQGLEKVFDREKLKSDFFPIVIFEFLHSTGSTFTIEKYEDGNIFCTTRQVQQCKVTFQAEQNDNDYTYTIILE